MSSPRVTVIEADEAARSQQEAAEDYARRFEQWHGRPLTEAEARRWWPLARLP